MLFFSDAAASVELVCDDDDVEEDVVGCLVLACVAERLIKIGVVRIGSTITLYFEEETQNEGANYI